MSLPLLRREPTEDEKDTISVAMDALLGFARSIDMPPTMFMSAVQAFTTKNLSMMDAPNRKQCMDEMEKIASNVYKKRLQNDPSFRPIRSAENGRDAQAGVN
jgi:hypothetical protein